MNRYILPIASLVVAAGTAMGSAQAVDATRNYLIQPTANCQGAAPTDASGLRKTPLAVKNIGTTGVFVSCGFQDINNFATGYQEVAPAFINNSAVEATISCTLVNGILNPTFFAITYFPKTLVLAAGDVDFIDWEATADNGGTNFAAPALSCVVPGGVELNVINVVYPEDVGS